MNKSAQKNIFLGLGANLATADINLSAHIESIFRELATFSPKSSPRYSTPAFPKGAGPDFINAVIQIETELAPTELLGHLHKIEAAFFRERPYRWAPRSCDIDLLFYGDTILPDLMTFERFSKFSLDDAIVNTPTQLILPHPRLHERAFVLGPMRDIAPDFVHPIFGETIDALWQKLPQSQRDEIKIIE